MPADDLEVRIGEGHRVLYLVLRLGRSALLGRAGCGRPSTWGSTAGELIARALGGLGNPANQLVPATIVGHNPEIPEPRPDPEEARRLLSEAGYPEGFATNLDGPANRYVNDVGILAEVAPDSWARSESRSTRGRATRSPSTRRPSTGRSPFHLLGWASDSGDSGDAIEFLAHSASGPRLGRMNTSAMADAAVDALVLAANRATNHRGAVAPAPGGSRARRRVARDRAARGAEGSRRPLADDRLGSSAEHGHRAGDSAPRLLTSRAARSGAP